MKKIISQSQHVDLYQELERRTREMNFKKIPKLDEVTPEQIWSILEILEQMFPMFISSVVIRFKEKPDGSGQLSIEAVHSFENDQRLHNSPYWSPAERTYEFTPVIFDLGNIEPGSGVFRITEMSLAKFRAEILFAILGWGFAKILPATSHVDNKSLIASSAPGEPSAPSLEDIMDVSADSKIYRIWGEILDRKQSFLNEIKTPNIQRTQKGDLIINKPEPKKHPLDNQVSLRGPGGPRFVDTPTSVTIEGMADSKVTLLSEKKVYLIEPPGLDPFYVGLHIYGPTIFMLGCGECIIGDGAPLNASQVARKPVVYVYGYDEKEPIGVGVQLADPLSFCELIPHFNRTINLMEADCNTLSELPGIGSKLAERIIEHRSKNPINTLEDLLSISQLSTKTLDKIRPFADLTNVPKYWEVHQGEKGGVIDTVTGGQYPYLFWEAIHPSGYPFNSAQATCLPKNELDTFLKKSLHKMGLSTWESHDFREFWIPLLSQKMFEAYPYVLVEFLTETYTSTASLHVYPKPDQVIRVFAHFRLSERPVQCGNPEIPSIKRGTGKLIVEWGGTESFFLHPDSKILTEVLQTEVLQKKHA